MNLVTERLVLRSWNEEDRVPQNQRSRRVMERIGLTHNAADDFDHPRFPHDDRLRRHVLYRLSREQWLQSS